jgi:hypothetical protein
MRKGKGMSPAIDLKIVLDQYNRQLTYFRDTAMKLVAAIAAYAGLHAGSVSVALTEKTYKEIFLTAHFGLIAFVIAIGSANYSRMASSHKALVDLLGPDPVPELSRLGILRREPVLAALAWSSLYAVVHGGFLLIVYLVKWH